MDRETRQRVAEAKRELAEVLQSLGGRAAGGTDQQSPTLAVFTGNVTIARFVQCTHTGEHACEQLD